MPEKPKKRFLLSITPSIPPQDRHKIEDTLNEMGYDVWGGGTDAFDARSSISFDREDPE